MVAFSSIYLESRTKAPSGTRMKRMEPFGGSVLNDSLFLLSNTFPWFRGEGSEGQESAEKYGPGPMTTQDINLIFYSSLGLMVTLTRVLGRGHGLLVADTD